MSSFKKSFFKGEIDMSENIEVKFTNKLDISILDKNFYMGFLENIRKLITPK